ncbi:hypothetical protein UFOVP1228_15 [uncultured Caudovirales phage]|uniref:Uncharacterized protein n=1 Tax=uncultured Caudovirales phage TaxID=2100421 RepID=A0A6J5PRA6_9CAUD|nr:hypothetical protein UFOVP956_15 [uncultured Caudovirales phage]CAB4191222.1 hypothetical protein UFOVP1228_15 [uncultured Caudovirales phage]CAB4215422.1 hypothetical protein UFOVP1481_23 [uncultured Caudovirales phage]
MLHPSFQYRRSNTLNLAETIMMYQYQFERLENVKIDLLIIGGMLLTETNLQNKADLLKKQVLMKQESLVLEKSIKLSLQCWEILAKNKEYN